MSVCPDCKNPQFSPMDKKYLELFKTCWSCDEKKWDNGEMTDEQFQERELAAHERTTNPN